MSSPPALNPSPLLVVLSDTQVRYLLENLTPTELQHFVDNLAAALHDYSTNSQADDEGACGQPLRTSTYSPSTDATTLYMPASGPGGMGVKVVTVSPPTSRRSHHRRTDSGGITPAPAPAPIQPTGAITLFGPSGEPTGFLHARTLTGFRTALASLCLVARRSRVQTIIVFGSGTQAYWHVRLALKLRGSTIRDVHIVNRRFSDGARGVLRSFYNVPVETRRTEGWEFARFSLLTPSYNDYDRLLAEQVRSADVVFCCTPSTEDLFAAEVLTAADARKKGRLVVAIGSYRPDMRELPDGLLRQAIRAGEGSKHFHFHRHANEGGAIVVDTLDGVVKESGEIIQGGIGPHHLVELGELVMLHRLHREEQILDDNSGEGLAPTPPTSQSSDTPQTPESPFQQFWRLRPDEHHHGGNPRRLSISGHDNTHSDDGDDGFSIFGHKWPISQVGSNIASNVKRRLSLNLLKSALDDSSRETANKDTGQDSSYRNRGNPDNRDNRGSHEKSHRKNLKQGLSGSKRHKSSSSRDDDMAQWLQDGNVIYKSVGFGLMDLVVSMQVVKVATEKGIGSSIDGFGGL